MIWYHYWVSEVKWFRENKTPCSRCWFMSLWPTRDPFPKINPRAISEPIIHVWLKICRNSSILRIQVIIILKKSRNRNIKYKSLQNSVLIYKDTVPLFTKKITTAVLIRSLNERWYLKIICTLFLSFWIFTEVFSSRSAY